MAYTNLTYDLVMVYPNTSCRQGFTSHASGDVPRTRWVSPIRVDSTRKPRPRYGVYQ